LIPQAKNNHIHLQSYWYIQGKSALFSDMLH